MTRTFKRDIYAAKVNINQNIFNHNVQELVPLIGKAILNSKGKKYEEKLLKWVFTEVREINLGGSEYIVGKLCKIKKDTTVKKFDDINHKNFIDKEKNLSYESVFLFDNQSELLIFEETCDIEKDKFIRVFEKLCYICDQTLGEIIIKFFPNSKTIEEYLNKLDRVYMAKFKIIPANFKSNRGFKKLDSMLKEENIREVDIVLKNKDGNILTYEDSFFYQCLEMVKNAYGNFIVSGRDRENKKKIRVDSEYAIHKRNINYNENLIEYISEFHILISEVKVSFTHFLVEKINNEKLSKVAATLEIEENIDSTTKLLETPKNLKEINEDSD
jgi:hypothetical protein